MRILKASILAVTATVWLAGCSTLAPKLEAPDLSIVNVELMESTLFEQRVRVRMRVQNPNDRALPVRGLSYTLEVDGKELAWGVNDVSPAQFRRQIELALREGYRFVAASEIGRTGGSPRDLAITFDDGLKSTLTIAAPILGRPQLLQRPHASTRSARSKNTARNGWAMPTP